MKTQHQIESEYEKELEDSMKDLLKLVIETEARGHVSV